MPTRDNTRVIVPIHFYYIKKYMKKISVLCIILIATILGTHLRTAQADMTIISDQSIGNVTHVDNQTTGSYTVGFTINSGSLGATNFKYAIKLIPIHDDIPDYTTIGDEKVYDETLTIAPHQSIERSVMYTPPTLKGTYRMIVETKNENGLPLSSAFVTDITLTPAQQSGIYIDPASCSLSIGNDPKTYNLTQGVDVLPSESLYLSCTVSNTSVSGPTTASADFVTNNRTTFGAISNQATPAQQQFQLIAGQSKMVRIEIPKPANPQAYDTTVTLSTHDLISSNPIIVHWVLQGKSATIQNISFDKQAYSPNDTVGVSFAWTTSAGAFADARNQAPEAHTYTATVQMCGATQTLTLDTHINTVHVSVPLPTDCQNPSVSINILGDGVNLATMTTTVPVAPLIVNTHDSFDIIGFFIAYSGIWIVLALILLLIIVFWYMKSHKLSFFILIATTGLMYGIHDAHAQINTYYQISTLDKNTAYYCTNKNPFLRNGIQNAFNNTSTFSGGDSVPILTQPIQGTSATYSCVTVSTPSNSVIQSLPTTLTSQDIQTDGTVLFSYTSNRKNITATGTPVTFSEIAQMNIVSNTQTAIQAFENSSANPPATGIVSGTQLTNDPNTTAHLIIPTQNILSGTSFAFNAYTFIGRMFLYNGTTLVAQSPWTQLPISIKPPYGGITLLSGGTGTLGIVDPANGNTYAFQFSMTNSSYNPSTQFYPGQTIYLKNILSLVVLTCTNGAGGYISTSYQVHPQTTPLDQNGTWTSVSNNGKDYVPTVNTASAPLAPGDYYMDIKITQPLNLEHQYYEPAYQYGIVRIPFTIHSYPQSLTVTPEPCTGSTSTTPVSADLAWNNDIMNVEPFISAVHNGYTLTYAVKRIKTGDSSGTITIATSSTPTYSTSSRSYSFTDTNLSPATAYQYWVTWTASKSGNTSYTANDPSIGNVYTVTNQCGTTVSASCHISSSSAGSQAPNTPTTISWDSYGYDTCTINNVSVTPTTLGSMTVQPVNTSQYVLQCTSNNHANNLCAANTQVNISAVTSTTTNTATGTIVLNNVVPLVCSAYTQDGRAVTIAGQNQRLTWKIKGGISALSWTLDGVATTTPQPSVSYTTSGIKYASASVPGGGTCNTSVIINQAGVKEL